MREKGWKFQQVPPAVRCPSPQTLDRLASALRIGVRPTYAYASMRYLFVTVAIVLLAGCGDASSGPTVTPASIEIVQAPGGPFYAGLPVPVAPAFVVRDQNGNPLARVTVTATITAGGGMLANAPTKSAVPSTPIGVWTLGKTPALNSIKISVNGVPPAVVEIPSNPGVPAKLVAAGPTTVIGTVGQPVSANISATLRDAFDNPIPGTDVTVALTGGGDAVAKVTTDNAGLALIPAWTLGTVKGTQTLTLTAATATLTFSAAAAAGPVETLDIVSGNNQSGLAGTELAQPVILNAADQYGNTADGVVVNFSTVAGGGSLASFTATAAADGAITMPRFTLGKSALPQRLIASIGGKSAIVSASVISDYVIDVRLWGPPMTPEQQILFTNAASRIRGLLVGAVPTVDATGADPALCGATGVPVLAESVPGVIIYASVQSIDGPGRVLARAGPCYTRDQNDLRTVVGLMEFDADDLNNLSANGSLQDVITHEMLHVIGFGVFWNDLGLLTGFDTPSVAYTGAGGIAGCVLSGGTTSCLSSVPVESVGGGGTANSHWRETTFGPELMTGFANSPPMPLSIMTVRSLADLGYTINGAAADSYRIFIGNLRAGGNRVMGPVGAWEQGLGVRPRAIPSRRDQPKRQPADDSAARKNQLTP